MSSTQLFWHTTVPWSGSIAKFESSAEKKFLKQCSGESRLLTANKAVFPGLLHQF